jgi:hypothetical protein
MTASAELGGAIARLLSGEAGLDRDAERRHLIDELVLGHPARRTLSIARRLRGPLAARGQRKRHERGDPGGMKKPPGPPSQYRSADRH